MPKLSRREYLFGLVEELFVFIYPDQTFIPTSDNQTTPSTPTTPLESIKRSLSFNSASTPVSSKKQYLDSRKRCQIRESCGGANKTNITCTEFDKCACSKCLEEQQTKALCVECF
jgi:hypothetical protein